MKFKNLWSCLDLEFKNSQGTFEEYNTNWLYLKTLQYQPNNSFDFTKPGSYPTQVVKINTKDDKVADLEH